MMQWFGDRAPNHFWRRMNTPAGENCDYCEEVILESDCGFCQADCGVIELDQGKLLRYETRYVWHRNCFLRTVTGSVGHQMSLCRCFGGDFEDPPGMSRREAANAAVEYYETNNRRGKTPAVN